MEIKEFNESMELLTKDEILRIKAAEVTMEYYGKIALSHNKECCPKPWKSNDEISLADRIKSLERYFRTGEF